MKIADWILGLLITISFLAAVVIMPVSLYYKWFYTLTFACFITLLRLAKGPTSIDRAAGVKVLSVVVIGFCGIMATMYKNPIYIDIAIIWAFQAFVGTVVLGKYIEGKPLDE